MLKNKKVLFIDVGSHECQEINALTQSNFFLTLLYLKRFLLNLVVKDTIAPSILEFIKFLIIRKRLLSKIKFCFFAIEPNWRHFRLKLYQKIDYVFCFGLQKLNTDIEMKYLSFKSIEKKCQGANLFEENGNINLSEIIPVLDTDYFCDNILKKILNEYPDDNMPKIILRLNCEGTEDDIIYSFNKKYSKLLLCVLGSLDDVRKKKGLQKAEILDQYLIKNSIDFSRFSSNMNTWPKTIKFLEDKLK